MCEWFYNFHSKIEQRIMTFRNNSLKLLFFCKHSIIHVIRPAPFLENQGSSTLNPCFGFDTVKRVFASGQ